VKEPNIFHSNETEKITRKASDAAENLQCCSVLPPEIVMHDMYSGGRPPIYTSCMTISGERTEQVTAGLGELAVVD